jgi:arylsulfatase A-like enzyme
MIYQYSTTRVLRATVAPFAASIGALFLSTAILCSLSVADEHTQPNIVLFLIDDLGWMDIGCQGSTYYRTPNIDRLASNGVRFTDAYAACAVCSPTRAAVLTGKYPARLMLTDWLPSGRWNPKAKLREGRFLRGLPVEEFTLAESLRAAGYCTANIGKWHLGSEPFSLPEHHGFDVNIAGNAHGAPGSYFFPYQGNWLIPTTELRAKWNVLPDGKEGEYLTDRLTDEAVKFIRESKDKPRNQELGAAISPLLPALRRPHPASG